METVAGSDLLESVLDDQRRPRVLVIISGLLFVSVNQDDGVRFEVFTYHDEILTCYGCPGYFGRRECGEGVTDLHAVECTSAKKIDSSAYNQRYSVRQKSCSMVKASGLERTGKTPCPLVRVVQLRAS